MDIMVSSKTGLSTSLDALVKDINDVNSNISSMAASLRSITDCDEINLSGAAATIISNFDSVFESFSNVAESANNYIKKLIEFDIDDFSTGVVGQTVSSSSNSVSTMSNYSGSYASSVTSSNSNSTSVSSTSNAVDESVIQSSEGTEIILPSGLGDVRTYMGWQCITNTSSTQYKLMQTAGMNFDEEGFGIIGDRYVVATTTTYGEVGDYIDVYQEDGSVLITEALRPYMGGKTIITPKK